MDPTVRHARGGPGGNEPVRRVFNEDEQGAIRALASAMCPNIGTPCEMHVREAMKTVSTLREVGYQVTTVGSGGRGGDTSRDRPHRRRSTDRVDQVR